MFYFGGDEILRACPQNFCRNGLNIDAERLQGTCNGCELGDERFINVKAGGEVFWRAKGWVQLARVHSTLK